jgi:hypothetical protein
MVSHPYFGQVWGWSPTLGKCWDLESSGTPECSKLDSKGQNTSHWGVLSVIGKAWNLDIENALALAIRTFAAQVMGRKKGRESNWLLTTKSRESTSSRGPIRVCNMAFERSWWGLQLWLRPRCDPTLQSGVMAVQCFRSLARTISGLHFGSPNKMCHLDVAFAVSCRKYYRE